MAASRAADCLRRAPGNTIEVADGEQAYIQAELKGTPCWVSLPPEERPAACRGFRNPVMQLKKALYGHPDSGTMWEEHCDKQLVSVGFQPIGPEWPSCYWHQPLGLFLVVYVDDFILAGPQDTIKKGWKLMRQGLVIEPEKLVELFLGCMRIREERRLSSGVKVTTMTSCVDLYLELAPPGTRLKTVPTPFLIDTEDPRKGPAGKPVAEGPVLQCSWCKHTAFFQVPEYWGVRQTKSKRKETKDKRSDDRV